MAGYIYILEHPNRPGWIHVGISKKKKIHQALWCLNYESGLSGNFSVVLKAQTKKPRFVYRAMLLWLAPYRVSKYFHRYDKERAASLLLQYAHNAKSLFGKKKGPWPMILPEDQRFFEMMDRAKDIKREKKYGKKLRKKKKHRHIAEVIPIQRRTK